MNVGRIHSASNATRRFNLSVAGRNAPEWKSIEQRVPITWATLLFRTVCTGD